jgi:hypothetical protein
MKAALILFFTALSALAADAAPTPAQSFDRQLKMIENELVSLAEAMPAGKYSFSPTQGEFATVRTFGQQVSHVAAVIYICSASVLGEPVPKEAGEGENGPPGLKTKEDILNYLKTAFVYGHKAMNSITRESMMTMIRSPFGEGEVVRLNMITAPVWHSFDHYGQMVVYARMNGVVPPASRR